MGKLFFENALLPEGWARDVTVEWNPSGDLVAVEAGTDPEGADRRSGIAVPGLPNLHSHAFQRGMAGLAEIRGESDDSFWTWREVMYRFLDRLTPDDVEAIATLLYVEMLESGFTAVGEFHYLHHDIDGRPYADLATMAARIAAAAERTGIGLTLLPVFYAQAGFGAAPPTHGQRRFVNTPDRFADLVAAARVAVGGLDDAAVGVAPHSLRAVTPDSLAAVTPLAGGGPIHIHVAEQVREVEDCIAWSGRRPVEWLLDNAEVDDRWCLVHATHMTADECLALADSGAVTGLCPIAEANLGDGLFDAPRYLAAGGRFGIGSDSHVLVSATEELRLLEYGQRLATRSRNVLAAPGASVGRSLYEAAATGGAQAVGRRLGALAPGHRADLVVLDPDSPALAGKRHDGWLDGWIFAGGDSTVREVWVHGRQVVDDGRHPDRDRARAAFRDTVARLAG